MGESLMVVWLLAQVRVLVRATLRRELGLEEGSELAIRADGRRLILEPRSEVLRRVRSQFEAVPPKVSLVRELSADRREQARRERRERRER